MIVKSIENTDEAARLLRDNNRSLIDAETSIDWKRLTAMRNVLTHRYLSIDYELV